MMSGIRVFSFRWILMVVLILMADFSWVQVETFGSESASGTREDRYRAHLKSANEYVSRKKSLEANLSGALSASRLFQLLGRPYQEGDTWVVAATRFMLDQHKEFAEDPSERVNEKKGPVGLFKYEVKEVRRLPEHEIVIRVTEIGDRKVDNRVHALELVLSGTMELKNRTYELLGGDARYQLTGNGIHSRQTLLDLFPLSFSEIRTAFEKPVTDVPALPEQLKPHVAGGKLSVQEGAVWLEQNDLFGRRVRVLWENGKLWPTYVETPGGAAVLVEDTEVRS